MSPGVPEDEGERRGSTRTPPGPKKPLDEFLREFEERLARGESATTAGQMLEQRAGGTWRPPAAAAPAEVEVEVEVEVEPTPEAATQGEPSQRTRKRRHKHRRHGH